MRVERWYWLVAFCVVSLIVQAGIVAAVRGANTPPPPPRDPEIVVALQPDSAPAPKPEVKPTPPKKPKPIIIPEASISKPEAKKAAVPHIEAHSKTPMVAKALHENVHKSGGPAAGNLPFPDDKPAPLGVPTASNMMPHPEHTHIALNNVHAGGAPSPTPIPGGKGGAPTPEAPPEEVLYNGGGKGGIQLPKGAPSIGGGGGPSVLSVNNPLAKDLITEDKPGAGPGTGGNVGAGSGGGVGFGNSKGIGVNPNSKIANASLSNQAGQGNGNASGNGAGTRAPGGGHGTGSDLPGTGGDSTTGYGRGKGTGIGTGVPSGAGGSGSPAFGDVAGLLGGTGRGGGGTGPGGKGDSRGGVFGAKPQSDSKGAVHIVYVLDISGSMRDGNKIGKAKEVLKQALLGLKEGDSFNIVAFSRQVRRLYPDMLPADPEIIRQAVVYVDSLRVADGTNISEAMLVALHFSGVSQIYLMSDGEPNAGIVDFQELRDFIHDRNPNGVRISTMGLCLGEQYKGEPLMKGIAHDTAGTYTYINMSQIR